VYSAKGRIFNNISAICKLDESQNIVISDKSISSSERMFNRDYYRNGSVEKKISGRESQVA
jgi:hypothetical protein